MFGYRNLGFGSFPSRSVGAFEWSTTLTLGASNYKNSGYTYGFDTDVHENSASIGSLSDNTIDGMFDAADGASQEVTLIRLTWVLDGNTTGNPTSLRVKFSPNVQHGASNQALNWDSVTVNGTEFPFQRYNIGDNHTDGSWNYNQALGGGVASGNDYSYPYVATYNDTKVVDNPFGTTTAGGNFTVTFKSGGF